MLIYSFWYQVWYYQMDKPSELRVLTKELATELDGA